MWSTSTSFTYNDSSKKPNGLEVLHTDILYCYMSTKTSNWDEKKIIIVNSNKSVLTISFAVLAKNALHLLMLFSRLIIFCGLFEWNLSKLWWKANTEPNGSTFFLPEPTVLPNWKENEMKKVHTSLTQHSCLMFIDRNTICMSNYCTQHTSYISSKYMLFGSEKNFVVGGWRWKYSWGRGTESSRDQLLQDAIWFWRVEKYSHLGKFMGHIR